MPRWMRLAPLDGCVYDLYGLPPLDGCVAVSSFNKRSQGTLSLVIYEEVYGRMIGHTFFLLACSSNISPFSSIFVIFLQGILEKEYVV